MTPIALSTNEKMGDETVATKVAELPNVEIKMDAVSLGETAQSSEDFRLGSWSEKEISRNFDLYFWKKTLVSKVIGCWGQLHFCYSMGHSPNSPGIRGPVVFSSLSMQDFVQEGDVHFGESAWSFPLVIGLAPAGMWDVTFSILLLLLNLGMAKLRNKQNNAENTHVWNVPFFSPVRRLTSSWGKLVELLTLVWRPKQVCKGPFPLSSWTTTLWALPLRSRLPMPSDGAEAWLMTINIWTLVEGVICHLAWDFWLNVQEWMETSFSGVYVYMYMYVVYVVCVIEFTWIYIYGMYVHICPCRK